MTEGKEKVVIKKDYESREIELISEILDGINNNIIAVKKSIKNAGKTIKQLVKDRDSFHKILSLVKEGK